MTEKRMVSTGHWVAWAWCDPEQFLCHIVTVSAGCSQAIPLVPLTEENEEAMENEQFQHLLRKLGIRPPSSGQVSVRASERDRVSPGARSGPPQRTPCCCPDPPCCLAFASQGSQVRSLTQVSLPFSLPFPKWCSTLPPCLSAALMVLCAAASWRHVCLCVAIQPHLLYTTANPDCFPPCTWQVCSCMTS
jgi:hypothetical protein